MSSSLAFTAEELCKQEQEEWANLNQLLKRHGFNSICLNKSGDCRGLSDVAFLDKQSSVQIRSALKSLIEDTERQQTLIHGLIKCNTQLKEDLRQQQGRASRQEQRAVELERILDNVKSKIRALEDDFISKACQHHNQLKVLQKDKQVTQTRYNQQKQKLHEQEETIGQLQKKLYKIMMEEEQRVSRQNNVPLQFQEHAPSAHSTTDQQRYEDHANNTHKKQKHEESLDLDATPNYNALLKSYQDQLRESKRKNEQHVLLHKNLQRELEGRPTTKELKICKQQVKRLEKILLQNNINSQGHVRGKAEERKEKSDSTRVEDVDHLQSNLCREYLQVLTSINSVVSGHKAPQLLYKQSRRPLQNCNSDAAQNTGFEHILPTIEMWADQLVSFKELHRSLEKLTLKLVPMYVAGAHNSSEAIRVEDLHFLVDTILEEEENKEKGSDRPSPQALQSFVLHFQKLFDVTSLNGIFPRLNDVYMKLEEMNNAMRNLRDLLGLGKSKQGDTAPPSTIVNMVGKLCSVINDNTNQQVQQLLGALDIDIIIRKLEEHDDFFPAFEALTRDLLHILEISHLDDIVPAVQKLKVLAT